MSIFRPIPSRAHPYSNISLCFCSSMSQKQNPFQAIFRTYETIAQCVQTHLSNFTGNTTNRSSSLANEPSLFSISSSSPPPPNPTASQIDPTIVKHSKDSGFIKTAKPVTKEELGRATWTLLHTLAAQFPDHPTKQQKRDVKELMAILSRLYPCKDCADHFKDVLSANPVQAGSQAELSQWMCHVHNVVNRSLGKRIFPCQRVDARWGKLECENRACDLEGTTTDIRF